MDSLQDQVFALNIKIDALHQVLEHLGDQSAEILASVKRFGGEVNHNSQSEAAVTQTYHTYHSYLADSSMEHKDVLADVGYLDSEIQGGDRSLTPEVQIQRLTAQLTAAYNRIAALEEQLLAKRIH